MPKAMLRAFKEIEIEGSKVTREIGQGLFRNLSIFGSEIRQEFISEGDTTEYFREDGSTKTVGMECALGRFEISEEVVKNTNLDYIYEQLTQAVSEIANQIDRLGFRTIDEGANEVGNVIRTNEPFGPQHLIEFFRLVDMSFNDQGKWKRTLVYTDARMFKVPIDFRDSGTLTAIGPIRMIEDIKKWLDMPDIGDELERVIDKKRREHFDKKDN